MAMSAGSITVNQTTGVWSGSGAAGAVMPAVLAPLLAQLPAGSSFQVILGVTNGAAIIAEAIAALVPYIQSNGNAVANANAFGSGIPASTVDLAIT
jgi:hypothetical protein